MKLIVEFLTPIEELAMKRTNQAIKSVLNVLDFVEMDRTDRANLRKVILDEINGMREDLISYVKSIKEE